MTGLLEWPISAKQTGRHQHVLATKDGGPAQCKPQPLFNVERFQK
jgi:hypothetical protein